MRAPSEERDRMMAVRTPTFLLLALCLGCGFPTNDPGEVFIPNDDDVADDSDAVVDDDDVANDDDAADDDDGVPLELRVRAVLRQVDDLGPEGVASSEHFAMASFGVGGATDWGDPDDGSGLPLPGAMLHPDRAADTDLCETLRSTNPPDVWPTTTAVGGVTSIVPSSGAPPLDLTEDGGLYRTSGAGELPAQVWSLQVKGGGEWPPVTLEETFQLPQGVTTVLPGPGNIGVLTTIPFTWDTAETGPDVEILLFRWMTLNETEWTAVRCRSTDDGEMFVGASDLAAGTGPIEVVLSQAEWTIGNRNIGDDVVHAHLGTIRSVRYALDPG